MAKNGCARRTVSTMVAFSSMAEIRAKLVFALAATLLVGFNCRAQELPQAEVPAAGQQAETTTIPAGTRFALVLTSPIASKRVHRGDMIYSQLTAPVAVGNSVAIPAGTFVQGKVDKLIRNGTRGEMLLDSISVIFPNSYVANVAGPMKIESDEGTAWRVPSKGGIAGAIIAPAVGATAGALIGHSANSSSGTTVNGLTINPSRLQSTAIGGMVGLAAGGAVGLALLLHSRQFYVVERFPYGDDPAPALADRAGTGPRW